MISHVSPHPMLEAIFVSRVHSHVPASLCGLQLPDCSSLSAVGTATLDVHSQWRYDLFLVLSLLVWSCHRKERGRREEGEREREGERDGETEGEGKERNRRYEEEEGKGKERMTNGGGKEKERREGEIRG